MEVEFQNKKNEKKVKSVPKICSIFTIKIEK